LYNLICKIIKKIAANDIRLLCLNGKGIEEWSMRGGGGMNGEWTGTLRCPPGTAICGLKTQIEPPQDGKRDFIFLIK
jgi:hypothetical protein